MRIADLRREKKSIRAIAGELNRSPSTISREIRRNGNPDTRPNHPAHYRPFTAHKRAQARRPRPKPRKVDRCPELRDFIQARWDEKWSPEQIVLRREFRDRPEMYVTHESIYRALYAQAKTGLMREVSRRLRTGRSMRKQRRRPDQRIPRFTHPMVLISQWPAEVADRSVPGHWEGDLIVGTKNGSAIGTLERSTRYTLLVHLPDGSSPGVLPESAPRCCQRPPGQSQAIPDLGPRVRDGASLCVLSGFRNPGLLLRASQPLAARHEREHERPAAAVLPEGHGSVQVRQGGSGCCRRRLEPQAPEDARLGHPSRALQQPPDERPQHSSCCDDLLNPPIGGGAGPPGHEVAVARPSAGDRRETSANPRGSNRQVNAPSPCVLTPFSRPAMPWPSSTRRSHPPTTSRASPNAATRIAVGFWRRRACDFSPSRAAPPHRGCHPAPHPEGEAPPQRLFGGATYPSPSRRQHGPTVPAAGRTPPGPIAPATCDFCSCMFNAPTHSP